MIKGALIVFSVLCASLVVAAFPEKTGCARFDTQADAQASYEPTLDRDRDGIACELLP